MYVVVDLETSGGNPQRDRIIEIAAYLFDGEKVVDELVTLINPETNIPPYITTLTGINNQMVASSPKFYEVAKKLVQLTEGCVFVAHNAPFDYGFIRNEFQKLGFTYNRATLCTVRWSRKLIPGLPSYSLGNLCQSLNIQFGDRHRAAGDATATVKLLRLLLERNNGEQIIPLNGSVISREKLHPNLSIDRLAHLPDETGVYFMWNEKLELIYVGKSINIKSRISQHITGAKSRRETEMVGAMADITWELTGSELVALLLESYHIKQQIPLYNRAQRRKGTSYGLYVETDDNGYLNLKITNKTEISTPIANFTSQVIARKVLGDLIEEYSLCQKLCGLYSATGGCFHSQIGLCKGACKGEEPPEEYNLRVEKAMASSDLPKASFFLLDKGRNQEEVAVVKVECGKLIGWGFCDTILANGIDALHDCIKLFPDNRDSRIIIRSFLASPGIKKIPF
jgi:exonuclease, DNA polymerase III, epsilon subunit family